MFADTQIQTMPSPTIALVTDFGLDDPYVGIMKGVISSLAPDTKLIDLTHQIPPGDIQRGAFVLWQSAKDFPQDTIFLGVVDPGLGTDRKGICLKCQDQYFIGPDNGLFSYILLGNEHQAWELANPDLQLHNSGNTFHGRDIFAPASAYISSGTPCEDFGNLLNKLTVLPTPKLNCSETKLEGEILSVDRFGNMVTSLGLFYYHKEGLAFRSWLDSHEIFIPNLSQVQIMINDNNLAFANTFGNIPTGVSAGVIGSTGLLEIVSNQESAERLLGGRIGDQVQLQW